MGEAIRRSEASRNKRSDMEKVTGGERPPDRPVDGRDEPPYVSNMRDRLARLEGSIEWFRLVLAVVATVAVGGMGFLGIQVSRIDGKITSIDGKISSLSEQVSTLPEKINANLRDLTKTLAEAITAAKQTPPQVILMPAPASAPPSLAPAPKAPAPG
jgi:outer membrane murein-binding lipoprotein Lpp